MVLRDFIPLLSKAGSFTETWRHHKKLVIKGSIFWLINNTNVIFCKLFKPDIFFNAVFLNKVPVFVCRPFLNQRILSDF